MPQAVRKAGIAFLVLLFFGGAVALVRDTFYQGHDFVVFWKAASEVLSGAPAYDLYRDGEMVFKYPPWILPAFFPFALIPLYWAKLLWGGLEVVSLISVVVWLVQEADCDLGLSLAVTAGFWGIWAVHALDGQVTLLLMALAVWSMRRKEQSESKLSRLLTIIWALTAKVFTGISLLGVSEWRRLLKAGAVAIIVFSILSIPALVATKTHSPIELYQTWKTAAVSGGTLFDGQKVRGPDNQGLPALELRLAGIKAEDSRADVIAFLLTSVLIVGLFLKPSLSLPYQERWLMWLGLGAAIHPLAWFHTFVFAFPLCVLTLDRAVRSRKPVAIALAGLGTTCVAVVTVKTLGNTGLVFELASVKAWGVLLCAGVLLGLRSSGGGFPSVLLRWFVVR